MVSIPHDLIPLPTMPWDARPDNMPLDIEECRTAIWQSRGNITEAAKRLKIPSSRLRNFVSRSAYLSAELAEAREQLIDMAENVVYEALSDTTDTSRQDSMARFVLSGPGKTRGYGTGSPKVTINNQKGATISIAWGDGTQFEPDGGKVIEHEG